MGDLSLFTQKRGWLLHREEGIAQTTGVCAIAEQNMSLIGSIKHSRKPFAQSAGTMCGEEENRTACVRIRHVVLLDSCEKGEFVS